MLKQDVAIKVEKKDKNKNILIFEYQVLNSLKGLKHVPNVYDFVYNSEQNLIVMDLMGINLTKARRCLDQHYSLKIAIQILIEMLTSIREVHERGFIHRDVKASNFVLCRESRRIYIVDFGLAKRHLDQITKQPLAKRRKADFRGTVSFASLNAHNNIDLSRRDDIWSFYFTMLDFLNEKLEWREQRDYSMQQVKEIKTKCFKNPHVKLWTGPTKVMVEVQQIFEHIESLDYEDCPDYNLILNLLVEIYNRYEMQTTEQFGVKQYIAVAKAPNQVIDVRYLKMQMEISREVDFAKYFTDFKPTQQQKNEQAIMDQLQNCGLPRNQPYENAWQQQYNALLLQSQQYVAQLKLAQQNFYHNQTPVNLQASNYLLELEQQQRDLQKPEEPV